MRSRRVRPGRSVSVSGRLHARLLVESDRTGVPLRRLVEAALAAAEPWSATGIRKIDPQPWELP